MQIEEIKESCKEKIDIYKDLCNVMPDEVFKQLLPEADEGDMIEDKQLRFDMDEKSSLKLMKVGYLVLMKMLQCYWSVTDTSLHCLLLFLLWCNIIEMHFWLFLKRFKHFYLSLYLV